MQVIRINHRIHQKATEQICWVKNWTDKQAKEAAWLLLQAVLLPYSSLSSLQYNSREIEEALAKGFSPTLGGW
jgi:hypothetical protein